MKRTTPLGPGKKALATGSTFSKPRTQLARSSKRKRPSFTPASPAQRAKVSTQVCAVVECQRSGCDPAHLTPRSFRGCSSEDCVIALCREHHRQFDDGNLDLLPHLAGRGFQVELAHMQGHYDDPLSVVFRLSGTRWAPERTAARMARREYTHSPQCVHEGCTERANYYFSTRRDQQEEMARLRRVGGWRCVRHTKPEVVLSADAPVRETVLASYETDFGYPERARTHKFWAPEGETKGGNGFTYGPGFKAFAKDFPAGTRLIVTARVEIPSPSTEEA